ncbi:AraC family transcriptional regulator [Malikia sp.]|uniref:AraC family transcriptional regulator n=1 Tax=Malikia sp. TaxID=2070706 RepID=UPI002622E95F|nr:AraC family transcriptional regulator [Malikia sp.]MDD2728450.1 AraC family transcriptional regulator [Malikia sp.]
MAFVQAIAWAYSRRGLNPAAALAAAQIPPDRISDPEARISALQMERISGHAMRELDDEALGWFDRRLPWGSYGMLARASLGAPTLGLALKRWCRHHGLLADEIELQLTQADGVAQIALADPRVPLPTREFCHVSVLRNIHGLACWYTDSRIPLLEARFSFAAPPHRDSYAVLFPAPVRFSAAQTAIRFDARYLDLPLRRDEAAMNQLLKNALPLMVQSYRRDRLLLERVRQLLRGRPQDAHNAEGLAALLHVSPRTLHRQLHELGSSLQALKDAVRRERAIELLLRTQKPNKQLAEAIGFTSEKSFIRAFRGWTGQTPAEYRQQQRELAAGGTRLDASRSIS